MSEAAEAVISWYEGKARPLFKRWSNERVEGLDGEVLRLRELQKAVGRRFQTCFLGNSGVGKSTLINSLVDDHIAVLPQGGIGPLTALATRVRFSEEPFFRVTYHTGRRLNQLLFILERYLIHSAVASAGSGAPTDSGDIGLTPEEQAEAEADLQSGGDDLAEDGAGSNVETNKRVANLLIGGSQFEENSRDLPYLTSGLRAALGLPMRLEITLSEADRARIESVRRALEMGRAGHAKTVHLGEDRAEFLSRLHDHAAGFLAPLIHTIEVGWHAEMLGEGLVLVDLPGLGIANDEYRTVTAAEIRSARVVALVVDRSGVTEASADLLRSTGFLNSLLHEAGDDEADPPMLLVAVVKLDLTADDERRDDRAVGKNPKKRWVEYFDSACERAETMVRGQLHDEMRRLFDAGSQTNRTTKDEVIGRVLGSLRVLPVSALEHRRFHAGDEDEPARIREEEQSRIPMFREVLSGAARERHARVARRVQEVATSLESRIRGAVEVIAAQWEATDRVEEEAQRLRDELDTFLKPKQKEFLARQAEYRAFLNETMKATIKSAVLEATDEARKSIKRYLTKLEGYHWSTLRAAVRRGGAYVGRRKIDFPNDFTLIFEDPLAIVWSKEILVPLRRRTRELGEDHAMLVEEVAEWARSKGASVNVKLVEGLSAEVREQTQQFAEVGRELVKNLRETVKQELYEKIEARVRARCEKFVTEKQAEGTGVKNRMLGFFANELTDVVIETAGRGATSVMEKNYEGVADEIRTLLRKHPNPLDEAAEQIVDRHEDAVRRQDRAKQKKVLEEVHAVLAAAPLPTGA